MPRSRQISADTANWLGAWCERDRIESLTAMRMQTARQIAAENARCASLLDAAGFGDAASFLRDKAT